MKNKKTTIYDVAKETNLSIATISRVINNKGGYSPKTKELVNKAINKLSFIPNSTAKTLASNKSRIIGLVLSFDNSNIAPSNYLIQFLKGVLLTTSHCKYNILLETQQDKFLGNDYSLKPQLYEGLIFSHVLRSNLDYIHSFINSKFPVVYAGHQIPNDLIGHHVYGGYIEYKLEILNFLYEKGHRKIIVLESYHNQRQNTNIHLLSDIIQSFRKEKNLQYDTCQMMIYDIYMQNHLQTLIHDILSSDEPPDAIYTDSEASATIVYDIATQLGLLIPEDLSVISTVHMNNSGTFFQPPLSTVYINAFEMGKHAAELLISFIEKKNSKPSHEIPFEFIDRKSVKYRRVLIK